MDRVVWKASSELNGEYKCYIIETEQGARFLEVTPNYKKGFWNRVKLAFRILLNKRVIIGFYILGDRGDVDGRSDSKDSQS